jgi:predicted Zn-dependent protease
MIRNQVRGTLWSRLLIAVLALGMAAGGCATNPATGAKQISLVSRGQELEMGREADPAIISEYGLYDDPKLAAYVDSVGQRLGKVSHLPTMAWHFRLLDSPWSTRSPSRAATSTSRAASWRR